MNDEGLALSPGPARSQLFNVAYLKVMMGMGLHRDVANQGFLLDSEITSMSTLHVGIIFTVIITFVEVAGRRCAVSVAWIGSAGGLGGCYGDSELGHSSQHHFSKINSSSKAFGARRVNAEVKGRG